MFSLGIYVFAQLLIFVRSPSSLISKYLLGSFTSDEISHESNEDQNITTLDYVTVEKDCEGSTSIESKKSLRKWRDYAIFQTLCKDAVEKHDISETNQNLVVFEFCSSCPCRCKTCVIACLSSVSAGLLAGVGWYLFNH